MHLETFPARAEGDGSTPRLPRHVVRELRSYLTCGVLAHGFALSLLRLQLRRADRFPLQGAGLVSLLRRASHGRSGGASHRPPSAVDAGAPVGALLPWALRRFLARRPVLCGAVRRVLLRAVFG